MENIDKERFEESQVQIQGLVPVKVWFRPEFRETDLSITILVNGINHLINFLKIYNFESEVF